MDHGIVEGRVDVGYSPVVHSFCRGLFSHTVSLESAGLGVVREFKLFRKEKGVFPG